MIFEIKIIFVDVRKAHRGWKRVSGSPMGGDSKFQNYQQAPVKGGLEIMTVYMYSYHGASLDAH